MSDTECSDDDYESSNIWHARDYETIYVFCEINTDTYRQLIQMIETCDCNLPTGKPIKIVINSDGGDAYIGLNLYDYLRSYQKRRIITVCEKSLSAASLLFLAGNTRIAMPNCTYLIHSVSSEFEGTLHAYTDDYKNTKRLLSLYKRIYTERTKLPSKKINLFLKREIEIGATELRKYKICTNE